MKHMPFLGHWEENFYFASTSSSTSEVRFPKKVVYEGDFDNNGCIPKLKWP